VTDLTHVGPDGRPEMVDISAKPPTARTATARGELRCAPETIDAAMTGNTAKGAVIRTAELAGIMAAKRTAELIPLCHPLPLSKVAVRIAPDPAVPGFRVTAEARTTGPTGVEMEALTAVSVACLTLFDMLKGLDRGMTIGGIAVTGKSGGRSGDWPAPER
jgi:cyclic pyranopterin monophosphate synthase